ncbi:SusC/RagA family TonB-linked outer membrane protein [Pedobacter rhizosphaerae]|uniref:TonB-linked outer membrane protein, SusC/RagA family n=1 Tax=Pedobacter rhizosphaerae TaxID=390241 RepID=A0A1H9QKC9_9SPHI|nr:TonB-dependent receptor [Pedobacter rhizosphaerae]SER60922.1 TonB-linked outer membrane protein, SusC/RagA family [Pedobacter rhizosphaerae]
MDFNFNSEMPQWCKPKAGKKILIMGLSALSLVLLNETAIAYPNLSNAVTKTRYANKLDVLLKGKITDEKGETLVGVSLKLKGTTIVTTTDANGAFSINIPSSVTNPTLVVSYIGYTTQEVPVTGKTTVSIQLKSSTNDLDEVVVVGYNTVKKSDLTGAVTSVGAEEIRSRPVTNALQAIQGKAAGVDITSNERPGQVGSILIRGVRSLTASNSPLYVVDGIPLQAGGIDAINPNDIETIDILKDASATAIYGSRGANGVVLVTTKKGKAGKVTMDYVGTATIETLNDRTEMMNSAQYVEFRRDAFRRAGTYPAVPTLTDDRRIFAGDTFVLDNLQQGWANGVYDGSLIPTTDWGSLVTRTGVTQDHVLSVSGGTDKIKAYGSFGYLNQEGTQLGQDFERYSGKLSVEINPIKWFKMGTNLTASYGLQNYGFQAASASGASSIYFAARGMLPLAVPFDANGNRINLPGGDINIQNPILEADYNINLRKTLRTIGSIFAEVNLLKGLKYRVNFGPDFSNYYNGRYQDAKSVNRDAGVPGSINNYAQLNQSSRFAYTLDHLLYYDKTINKHNFGVTLLQSSSSFREESSSLTGSKIPLTQSLWYGLNPGNITGLDGFSTDLRRSTLASYMARANYSFDSKYLLTASARWDGASQLAAGNKWDFFPSAAIAWRLDQEDFIKNIKWVDQLKFRIGVGSTGNSSVDIGSTLGLLQPLTYTFGSSAQTGYVSSDASLATPIPLPNKLLSWEKTLQYNLGLDFDLLKGRISGSLDVYKSKTTDLILLKKIASVNGYVTSYDNIGSTKNKGIDLTLNTVNLKTKDFSWESTLNFSVSKDEIVKLDNGDMVADRFFIGQRNGVAFDYIKDGIWQNTPEDMAEMAKFNANIASVNSQFKAGSIKIRDLNGDYKIDANNDRAILGHYNPSWTGGLTNTFNYKNFDLSIFIIARYNFLIQTGAESLQGRFAQRVVDYWTPTNPTNDYPAPNYNSAAGDPYISSMNYQDASFIKIRNISLGYNFAQSLANKLTLSRLRVYAQAINPGLIYSNVKWIDPDLGGSTFNRGVVFGINASF